MLNFQFLEVVLTSDIESVVKSIKTLPNAAVIMNVTGKQTKKAKFFVVDGVKDTKPVSIVSQLLVAMLADYKQSKGFENEFSHFSVDGVNYDSNIKAKQVLKPYLQGNYILKTNEKGLLTYAISLDDGMKLSNTCLNVKEKDAITTLSGKTLKAGIHNQAKAFLAQTTYVSDVVKCMENLLDEMNAKPVTATKTNKNKKVA